jgi:hypothetical protein
MLAGGEPYSLNDQGEGVYGTGYEGGEYYPGGEQEEGGYDVHELENEEVPGEHSIVADEEAEHQGGVQGWMERGRAVDPAAQLKGFASAPCTSVCFDDFHDLLWVGRRDGFVQSFDITVKSLHVVRFFLSFLLPVTVNVAVGVLFLQLVFFAACVFSSCHFLICYDLSVFSFWPAAVSLL